MLSMEQLIEAYGDDPITIDTMLEELSDTYRKHPSRVLQYLTSEAGLVGK